MKLRNKNTGKVYDFTIKEEKEGETSTWNLEANGIVFTYDTIELMGQDWENERPKEYYAIGSDGKYCRVYYEGDDLDHDRKEIGNYFKTEEEAKEAMEKLNAIKRLKSKGFRFLGWHSFIKRLRKGLEIYADIPYADETLSIKEDLEKIFGEEQ